MQMTKQWARYLLCLWGALAMPVALFGEAATEPAAAAKPTAATKPAAPAPPADPTAVLKAIPADATAMLAVRNLKELDAHICDIAEKLGFPFGPGGIMPTTPLGFVKMNTGLNEGLNENASVAFVLLNCAEVKTIQEVPTQLAVFIPCSNADALIASMGGQKVEDQITVNLMGMPSVAAVKDEYLVLTQTPEALKAVVQAKGGGIIKSMAPDRVEAFKKQDLFGWINIRGISKEIIKEVGDSLTGLMMMVDPTASEAQAQQPFNQLNEFFDSAQELSFSLSLNKEAGLNLHFYSRLKPDSAAGKQAAALKTAEGSLLVGLPDESTVLAMGFMGAGGNPGYSEVLSQQLDKFLTPDLIGEVIAPEQLKVLKEYIVNLIGSLEQLSLSVSALAPAEGEGLIGFAKIAKVKNSQQAMDQAQKLFTLIKEIIVKLVIDEGTDEEKVKAIADAIQWKEKAETVDGVIVDHLAVDLKKIPDLAEEDIAEITGVIGKEGALVRVAAVGEKHIVVTFGGGVERFKRIVELVKKGESPLADNPAIKKIAGRLSAGPRLGEAYLNVDQILALIMNISNQVGQPLPFPLVMQNAAPISMMYTKVDDTAQDIDVLIPIELAVSVKNMAGPIMGALMMGGMGGAETPTEDTETAPAPTPPGGELK